MCHYCGYSHPLPQRCPQCGGPLKPVGAGTQRIEEELHYFSPIPPFCAWTRIR